MCVEAGKRAIIRMDSGEQSELLGELVTVATYVANGVWVSTLRPINGKTEYKVKPTSLTKADLSVVRWHSPIGARTGRSVT